VGHFLYPRHFPLLICLSVLLAVMPRPHAASDLNAYFALYGALHASALALTLRARQPIWQKCLFVAIAAGLSVVTLRIGIVGKHLSETLPGNAGLYTALGFSAVTGALIYGILIRRFWVSAMTPGSLAVICLSCLLATFAAPFTGSHFHVLGPWWLVVVWWHAFSGALWYCDQRHERATQGMTRGVDDGNRAPRPTSPQGPEP
jgi:hypothetical protein